MFKGFFGHGRRHRHQCLRGAEVKSSERCCAHPLSDFMQDVEVSVVVNSDRKTVEMGLCTGSKIRIVENRPGDANLVIAVGESRYIISKETAAKIRGR